MAFDALKSLRSVMPYSFCPACVRNGKRPRQNLKCCAALTPGGCPVAFMAHRLDHATGLRAGDTLKALRTDILITGAAAYAKLRERDWIERRYRTK